LLRLTERTPLDIEMVSEKITYCSIARGDVQFMDDDQTIVGPACSKTR
jgi:hypothetical protein